MNPFQAAQEAPQLKDTTQPKPNSSNTNPFFQYLSSNVNTNTNNQDLKGKVKTEQTKIQESIPTDKITNVPIDNNWRNESKPLPSPQVKSQLKIETSFHNSVKLHQQERSRSRDQRTKPSRSADRGNSQKDKKDEHFHKTKLCPLFQKGNCRKGSDCTYAHGQKQIRGLPNFTKTRLCIAFSKGQCKKRSQDCRYAHGQSQLQALTYEGFAIEKGQKRNRDNDRSHSRSNNNNRNHHRHNNNNGNNSKGNNNSSKNQHYGSNSRDRRSSEKNFKSHDRSINHHHQSKHHGKQTSHQHINKYEGVNRQYEKFLYEQGGAPAINNRDYLIPTQNPSTHSNFYSSMPPFYDPYFSQSQKYGEAYQPQHPSFNYSSFKPNNFLPNPQVQPYQGRPSTSSVYDPQHQKWGASNYSKKNQFFSDNASSSNANKSSQFSNEPYFGTYPDFYDYNRSAYVSGDRNSSSDRVQPDFFRNNSGAHNFSVSQNQQQSQYFSDRRVPQSKPIFQSGQFSEYPGEKTYKTANYNSGSGKSSYYDQAGSSSKPQHSSNYIYPASSKEQSPFQKNHYPNNDKPSYPSADYSRGSR